MHSQLTHASLALSTDLVIYTARLVRSLRRNIDAPAGVRVLSLLDEHGPLGVTQLAKLDRCSQPTMSAAVANLAEAGLVAKDPSPVDARSSVVSLTHEGSNVLATQRDAWATAITERLRAHNRTQEDLATAVSVLRDLLEPDPMSGANRGTRPERI
ncbi:MarR family transcriptional regulator [Nocardioides sp. CER19]|uniref:MarR family winged helix-turn-helix transcriptional regulator n=1 Tax=Nocardioides sp. CER19 TaxID=3038538 RepID=UPI00244D749E|nr:MarR family transcriptional regulator [Nocardioides sp. CER19]MDH2413997.1 MarR family transcriptional regulator [Nocardioides sp. CER19]